MKKISMLLLSIILGATLTGCSIGTEENDTPKEDVIATKTCTQEYDDYVGTYVLTATNDEIDKIEMTYVYNNSLFNVDTLATLTEEQKEQIKTNMLSTLGLDNATNEGMEIQIDIQDQMTVTIKADLKVADAAVLKKVGLDFSNTDMSLEAAVKGYEKDGATCQ